MTYWRTPLHAGFHAGRIAALHGPVPPRGCRPLSAAGATGPGRGGPGRPSRRWGLPAEHALAVELLVVRGGGGYVGPSLDHTALIRPPVFSITFGRTTIQTAPRTRAITGMPSTTTRNVVFSQKCGDDYQPVIASPTMIENRKTSPMMLV